MPFFCTVKSKVMDLSDVFKKIEERHGYIIIAEMRKAAPRGASSFISFISFIEFHLALLYSRSQLIFLLIRIVQFFKSRKELKKAVQTVVMTAEQLISLYYADQILFRVIDHSSFPDHCDFDLTGVIQIFLDFLDDITC